MENPLRKIGILREKIDPWERRVALVPLDCKYLVTKGIEVYIQSSDTRTFSDEEYIENGVIIKEDLSECDLIIGIYCNDPESLYKDKSYIFMLDYEESIINVKVIDQVLKKNIRLYDYNGMRKDDKKVLSFGKIGGACGIANLFKGIAEFLLAKKYSTPFIFSKLAYMHSDLDHLKESFDTIRRFILSQYLPEEICPFVICLLGNGNSIAGSFDVLKILPYEKISPIDLFTLKKRKDINLRDRVFICQLDYKDIYVNADLINIGSESDLILKYEKLKNLIFDEKHFNDTPDVYYSIFKYYLPYFSCIINGLVWNKTQKRLIKNHHLLDNSLYKDSKLIAIADLLGETNGPIEVIEKNTSHQNPFLIYEPIRKTYVNHMDECTREAIIYMSIRHISVNLPEDASVCFSQKFKEYALVIMNTSYNHDLELEVQSGLVAEKGNLTRKYKEKYSFSLKKEIYLKNFDKEIYNYHINLKLKGHVFDSGVFHKVIDDCHMYNIITKPVYMKIGENNSEISIIYLDLFSDKKENLNLFFEEVERIIQAKDEKIKLLIVGSNYK